MVFRRISSVFPCNRNSVILVSIRNIYRSLNSSVSTVTALRKERFRNRFQFSGRGNTFLFFTLTLASGLIQAHTKAVLGGGGHFPRVNRRAREISASSPSSAELTNMWSYTATSLLPHGIPINTRTIYSVIYMKFAF